MTLEDFGNLLAKLNALLNFSTFVLLLGGFVQIKRRRPKVHERLMRVAFCTSALFLVSYVTRFSLTGTHRFAGTGALRTVYLATLFSHMVLAAVVVPLVLRTLYLATRNRFEEHRRIAKVTLPVWLYVSVTGVIVYVMLYHVA